MTKRTARAEARRFEITADFNEFEKATEWFRSRLPVTTDQLAQLDDDARARAWWVSGVAQADVVQQVHESLTEAVAKGTPLEEWKKSIKSTLTAAWGRSNSPRIDTIFRNATQSALIAGRHQQIHDPQVKRFRPYGLFDGIDDGRQTEICNAADGTTLLLDHPWWATHTPLLHHRCRSSIRTLTPRQARARGITEEPTDVAADAGFGGPPALASDPPDKPRPKPIRDELERKLAKPKPKPLVQQKKVNPDHDPKRWVKHFEDRGYSRDVAQRLAWGRAMQERGLDLSTAEIKRVAKRLARAGIDIDAEQFFDAGEDTLRGTEPATRKRHAATIVAHHLAIQPNKTLRIAALEKAVELANDKRARQTADSALAFFRTLADKSLRQTSKTVTFRFVPNERAFFSSSESHLQWSERPGVLQHEITHLLDDLNPGMGAAAIRFRDERTRGETPQKLQEVFGSNAYDADEVALPDKWPHVYMGKVYRHNANEINSMGVEWMTDHRALRLLSEDAELYWFILGQLAGDRI